MAIHPSHRSMIKESLPELIAVAEYCVDFRKDPKKWGSAGCYGYPANIILLAIADAIGSYVFGGSTRKHFDILNHQDYYNLGLDEASITTIYEAYRCLGTHNAVLGKDVILDIGVKEIPPFILEDGISVLYLKPFLELSKVVVSVFLQQSDTLVPLEVKKK